MKTEDPVWMLIDYIDKEDLKEISNMLKKYPNLSTSFTAFRGVGVLQYASENSKIDVVKCLVDNGCDVNFPARWDGDNSLTGACNGGHYDIVEYLLDHGAAMDVSTSVRNPLFAAITESVKESMNKTWGPSTGEAPRIVRLLLERGIDSKVSYNTRTMKNMDAVAFSVMMGAHDLAHIIALWNAGGDKTAAQTVMAKGLHIAKLNTKPVPTGEHVAAS
jgi:Ankyrin repeats (3 copies)